MPVTSITFTSRPPRKKPKAGDTKTDKDGVTWVRHAKVFKVNGRVVGYDCTNGRQRYVWVREGESYP